MTTTAVAPKPVLFLFTEVCANGGIQRFNQTLLAACAANHGRCEVLSLQDSPTGAAMFHAAQGTRLRGFGGDRTRFVAAAAMAMLSGRYALTVIGHVNFLRFATLASRLHPARRMRCILVAHGIEVWSGIGPARRAALGRLHKILCVSRYTRQRILEQAPALQAQRLRVFPNALAHSWPDAPAATCGQRLPAQFLLSVTRLEKGDRYKGIATVIESLAMLSDPSIHYCVVGHGSDLGFLQSVARRFGVAGRVHFLSGVSDVELIELYRRCKAFVLPSGKEGFGIVFLEAMHFGAPVIAAAEKGALDVVRDAQTGLLVRYADCVALAGAIERLLRDPDLSRRLRESALASVTGDGPFTFASFARRCALELDLAPAEAA